MATRKDYSVADAEILAGARTCDLVRKYGFDKQAFYNYVGHFKRRSGIAQGAKPPITAAVAAHVITGDSDAAVTLATEKALMKATVMIDHIADPKDLKAAVDVLKQCRDLMKDVKKNDRAYKPMTLEEFYGGTK